MPEKALRNGSGGAFGWACHFCGSVALGVFIYGMKVMPEGVQKVAGNPAKWGLLDAASNSLSGVDGATLERTNEIEDRVDKLRKRHNKAATQRM